jgi:hypothetical protein
LKQVRTKANTVQRNKVKRKRKSLFFVECNKEGTKKAERNFPRVSEVSAAKTKQVDSIKKSCDRYAQ